MPKFYLYLTDSEIALLDLENRFNETRINDPRLRKDKPNVRGLFARQLIVEGLRARGRDLHKDTLAGKLARALYRIRPIEGATTTELCRALDIVDVESVQVVLEIMRKQGKIEPRGLDSWKLTKEGDRFIGLEIVAEEHDPLDDLFDAIDASGGVEED
jgi:hypothetical protein